MSSPDGLEHITQRDILRALVRLEREIQTIREEGRNLNGWYAFDRIEAIREVCDKLLQGDRMACVFGFGFEDENTARQYLDRYLDSGLHNTQPDTGPQVDYQSILKRLSLKQK